MKKILFCILPITLAALLVLTAAASGLIGDVNGDSVLNNKDAVALFQHLSGWDTKVDRTACDTNGDGEINNKDLVRLFQSLSGWNVVLGAEDIPTEAKGITVSPIVYGRSVNGRDLTAYCIAEESCDKTILLSFAIHGFEDGYLHDGHELVETAEALIEHYAASASLNRTRLIIVPCANPDGLSDGKTNNGFGRCNAEGIDLNRDFGTRNYTPSSAVRNYTPYAFSAPESRALRDLVLAEKPDIVIDFHGWESSLIGNNDLSIVFHEELGLNQTHPYVESNAAGYFSHWAQEQGACGMLVEFTAPGCIDQGKLINAIDRLINDEYENGTIRVEPSLFSEETVFMCPQKVFIDNNHYIAENDIGYIESVSGNLCKVVYPVGSSDVFAAGAKTQTVEIPLSYIIGTQGSFAVEEYIADDSIKVYPTKALTSSGTNWSVDPGERYTVMNETADAFCILYHADTGTHSGFDKIGYIRK